MRFQAAIHGVDLEKEFKKKKKTATAGSFDGNAIRYKGMEIIPGDIEAYEKLSPEEREELTQIMMGAHTGLKH